MADCNTTDEAAGDSDDQSSCQILGDWDFLDVPGNAFISPSTSLECVTSGGHFSSLDAAGNTRTEKLQTVSTKSPSSAVGHTRVPGSERGGSTAFPQKAAAGNVSAEKAIGIGGSSGGKGGSRRLLPPTIAGSGSGSEQWGAGKWKVDGRKKEKKTDEKTDSMFLKEVIEAVLRNSGSIPNQAERNNTVSYVEMLKAMGLKFPE